jgi:excisionase family DNA binding protein
MRPNRTVAAHGDPEEKNLQRFGLFALTEVSMTGQLLERALTVNQAAKVLDRSAQRVRQMVDEGKLPCIRTGYGRMFDPAEVERMAETLRRRGADTGPEAA